MSKPIFRFAPSPNGFLHLGHAYSALYNQKICKANDGVMLLRMENTDLVRCSAEYEAAIIEDLSWIGFEWQGDVRRQCEHFEHYASVLDDLEMEDLAYAAFMSRSQIKHAIAGFEEKTGSIWPQDPDGSPLYPADERDLDEGVVQNLKLQNPNHAWRLNIEIASNWLKRQHKGELLWRELNFEENAAHDFQISDAKIERIISQPEIWGDVVLGRAEIPASYHFACVIDDHLQGITHVVRGRDIFPATSIHRLLQALLGYGDPLYCHHDLIVDDDGFEIFQKTR